ncbi:MAG: glycoside hydrolase family 2 [Opitutae bacterium]|nr:glycoside hydrolase family 2 [Opitutae bacterium]
MRFPVARFLSLSLGSWLALAALTLAAASTETQIRYLSGTGADDAVLWDFFCTGGRRSGEWTQIRVPSCWEQEGFGTYNYGMHHRPKKGQPSTPAPADEQGKYRTEFTVPADWQGRTVRLVFEGAMTDTEVWIDGQSAGPVHQGGFYRFHYDITTLVRPGARHRLDVTVSKQSANESVNRAERIGDYWNFGGIFRPVWLEARPRQAIEWTAINARADGTFAAAVHLAAPAPSAGEIQTQLLDVHDQPCGAPFATALPAGAKEVSVRTRLTDPALWTAETPRLYRVRFTLNLGGTAQHTITERFGFRTLEVRPGDGFYLNGQKLLIKGINRHSFWPETGRTLSRRICYDDARLIKATNMNAVRMSHYPPDPDFLAACDELGLYVLNELAGWQGSYDTPTGARLIGQIVRRDANHPSILFWDNGNEGGWNTANDDEFSRWDPQRRPVLHPWELFRGITTKHYPSYAQLQQLCAGPDIFMPTEFLHGLYDGGIGAGLRDFWTVMRRSPVCAGGFFWVLTDEGVVRTDQNGRIDNAGNLAPDGIVGPHRDKEGSFFTVQEIWSPVQIVAPGATLPADFSGRLILENDYNFTSLAQCRLEWSLVRFARPDNTGTGHTVVAHGEVAGPAVRPGASGELSLPLPDGWRDADALYVTPKNPEGQWLWTWSWSWKSSREFSRRAPGPSVALATVRETPTRLQIVAGKLALEFDRATGELASVTTGGQSLALGQGPRLIAYKRENRQYRNLAAAPRLTALTARTENASVIVEARYDGGLRSTLWRIAPDGAVQLDYEYAFDGAVDVLGVNFDLAESQVRAKRWLGRGPYRAWQNRREGGVLDVWQTAFNDPIPGQTYAYPEFKGYFADWHWLMLETTAGSIGVARESGAPFFGLYRPQMGIDGLLDLPPLGLALLDVIPAMRDKFKSTDQLGPQSQTPVVHGMQRATVHFTFGSP